VCRGGILRRLLKKGVDRGLGGGAVAGGDGVDDRLV
jgi:hypothetical protein